MIFKRDKKPQFIDSSDKRLADQRRRADKKTIRKIYLVKYLPILASLYLLNGGLLKILLCCVWWLLVTIFYDHRHIKRFKPTIRIWFGVPGSGKTSMGAWLARNSIQHGYRVLSNVHIDNTYKLEESDLGNYDMSFDGQGCHVIYDEAVVNGLDNRNFKEFSKTQKPRYFSLHRHMNNLVDVFSQDYDVDLKIKGRAGENGLFHLRKLPIRGFVMYRCISKIFFIKKDDKQFIDGFKYKGLPRICYTRSVWNSFDTLDKSLCPQKQKEWKLWNEAQAEPEDLNPPSAVSQTSSSVDLPDQQFIVKL